MPSAVVAVTGASGARYGVRLIEELSKAGWEIDLIVSKAGNINLQLECEISSKDLAKIPGVSLHKNANLVLALHRDRLCMTHTLYVPLAEPRLEK